MDQPFGTGFSYASDESKGFLTTLEMVARAFTVFLRRFTQLFAEYQGASVSVVGYFIIFDSLLIIDTFVDISEWRELRWFLYSADCQSPADQHRGSGAQRTCDPL